jgi:hypothetical protein
MKPCKVLDIRFPMYLSVIFDRKVLKMQIKKQKPHK